MAIVYFKGMRVWHTADDSAGETRCTRCGFAPKIAVVTVAEKADSDGDCQAVPASVQAAIRRATLSRPES